MEAIGIALPNASLVLAFLVPAWLKSKLDFSVHNVNMAKQIAAGIKTGSKTRYGLAEASRLTNIPMSRFRYEPNKQKLISAGATVEKGGWSIPESALEALGWLSYEADVKTPLPTPARQGIKKGVKTPDPDPLLEQLKSENAYLREQLSVQTQTAAELSKAHAIISAQLAQIEMPRRESSDGNVNGEQSRPRSFRSWFRRSN